MKFVINLVLVKLGVFIFLFTPFPLFTGCFDARPHHLDFYPTIDNKKNRKAFVAVNYGYPEIDPCRLRRKGLFQLFCLSPYDYKYLIPFDRYQENLRFKEVWKKHVQHDTLLVEIFDIYKIEWVEGGLKETVIKGKVLQQFKLSYDDFTKIRGRIVIE